MGCRSQRGFSLLEMLASTALLAVALIIGWDMWEQGAELVAGAGRAMANPRSGRAAVLLRQDIQRAQSITTASEKWTSDPLVLQGESGGRVRYAVRRAQLERLVEDASGSQLELRVLASQVQAWSWRSPHPGVVDLRLSLRVYPDPVIAAARLGPAERAATKLRHEQLRLAMRAHGGGRSW